MNKNEIISIYQKTLDELKPIHQRLYVNNKLNLSDDNLYLAITFTSKIYGLNSVFNDEFIKDNNFKAIVKRIDEDMVKLQASHFQSKEIFYDFFNIVFPQLEYRLQQIKYKESLSDEEKKHLLITAEYQVYLYNLLKYYLSQAASNPDIQEKIKEILSIINLYKIINDKNIVALGSKITFMDTMSNEIEEATIVINSHADLKSKKVAIKDYKKIIGCKVNDVVCLDYALTYAIRILKIEN